jgi:hypothetical protein
MLCSTATVIIIIISIIIISIIIIFIQRTGALAAGVDYDDGRGAAAGASRLLPPDRSAEHQRHYRYWY